MNDYQHSETIKSVIEDIEASGDVVFQETFRNRLWIPVVLSALLLFAASVYLTMDTEPLNKALDVGLSVFLAGGIWFNRYCLAEVAASESKYAHAMSYLDGLEDEPEPDA